MRGTTEKFKALLERYGPIAAGIHIAVFCLVLSGFWAAFAAGFGVDTAAAGGGTLLAAYVATKATSPLRIAITLATTPLAARALDRPPATPEA